MASYHKRNFLPDPRCSMLSLPSGPMLSMQRRSGLIGLVKRMLGIGASSKW